MQLFRENFDYHFIPSRQASDSIMVVLHGRGDSLRPFKKLDVELGLKNCNYLLLNAPRRYARGYSWYGEPPYQKDGVMRMRKRIFNVLQDLEEQGWSSQEIFLLGYSQGSLVAADVALHYPRRLGGVINISGYFHFFPRWRQKISPAAKSTPWFFTHGSRDKILSIDETYFGVQQLKKQGLDVRWLEINKAHSFEDSEFPLIKKWVREQQQRQKTI